MSIHLAVAIDDRRGDLVRCPRSAAVCGPEYRKPPLRSLRGVGTPEPAGAQHCTVRFDGPEADTIYLALVQGTWFTLASFTENHSDGFDIEISDPSPGGAALD